MTKDRLDKLWKHLPGLMIPEATDGSDPRLQRNRRKLGQLNPQQKANLLEQFENAMLNVDFYIEGTPDGFGHYRTRKIHKDK